MPKPRTPQSGRPAVRWGTNGKWIARCVYMRNGQKRLYIGHFWPDERAAAVAAVESRIREGREDA